MKVVHLCASDVVGGAARSAYRLHAGLVRAGVDSEMLVLTRASSDGRVRAHGASQGVSARIGRRLWRAWQGPFASSHRPLGVRSLEIFSTDRSVFGTQVLREIESADVVNLHWVAGMFDFSGLAELTRRFPVVWTLHDMNPFTGGCHFDEGCGRFAEGCGVCPQLESRDREDVSAGVLRRKAVTSGRVETGRLTVVGPSRWLTGEARRSVVLGRFEAVTIPYGLETDVFRPRDRMVVRQLVDVPADAKVVLFVAEGLTNRRKGFDLLVEALGELEGLENTYLLAVGGGLGDSVGRLPLPVRVIPTVNDDRFLSFIYSAADVFVMASRADNLPNTMLESLSCGTPVVGFDVGGVPDVVVPEETGLLAAKGDTRGLAGGVRHLLSDDALRSAMGETARDRALANHTLERQAGEYVKLYGRLVAGRPAMGHRAESRLDLHLV